MLQLGISPGYVLDHMQPYEISALIRYKDYCGRDDWERARVISYNILRPWAGNGMAIGDVMQFPWDTAEEAGNDGELTTAMSEADRTRLTAKAKQYEKILNNGC